MPKKDRNRGIRCKYSVEVFNAAINEVRRGTSLSEVSHRFNIPRSTLGKHRYINKPPKAGRKYVLTAENETSLSKFLRIKASYGDGLTREEVKDLVRDFVLEAKIKTPWYNNRPGNDWLKDFLSRHKDLSARKAERMPMHRVMGSDPFIIGEFYTDVKKLYKELNITDMDGGRIYNCDETSFCHDPDNIYVIAEKGEKRISKNIPGSGKNNTTVLACGAADGTKLPPLIIFSGTYVWSSWVSNNDYPGTAYTAQKRGWMEGTIFSYWFEEVFLKNVPSKEERKGQKLVLFFDGASCHINGRLIKCAQDNDVEIVKFPPSTTQYLQPLDLCVFKPMKEEWKKILLKFNRENGKKTVDNKNFATLLRDCWEDGFKSRNLRSGFSATGLFPVDSSKFPQKAYNPEQLERFVAHNPTSDLLLESHQQSLSTPNSTSSFSEPAPSTSSEFASTMSNNPSPSSSPALSDSPSVIAQASSLFSSSASPLSFEEFIRCNMNKRSNNSPVISEPMKRRKVSVQKGEILTSVTVAQRIQASEKEKETKMLKKNNKPKLKTVEKISSKKPLKNKMRKVILTQSDSDSEDEDDPEMMDTDDSVGDFSEDNSEGVSTAEKSNIEIRLEKYHAVFYDISWYLGRVIDFYDENISKIKFLKSELDKYVWPKTTDIQMVNNDFIFYGPIELKGSDPFELSRSDLMKIKNKFSTLKQNLKL